MTWLPGRVLLADEETVEAIAYAIDPRFRALVLLLRYTALRWNEAVALRRRRCFVELPGGINGIPLPGGGRRSLRRNRLDVLNDRTDLLRFEIIAEARHARGAVADVFAYQLFVTPERLA